MEFGTALSVFKRIWLKILPFMVLMLVLVTAMQTSLIYLPPSKSSSLSLLIFIPLLAAFIVLLPVTILFLLDQAHAAATGEPCLARDSFSRSFKPMQILRVYGLVIVFYGIFLAGIMILLVLFGILSSLAGISLHTKQPSALLIIPAVLAACYFLYMYVLLQFSLCELTFGSRKVFASIGRTFQLIKGNFWYTFFSLFLFLLIFFGIGLIIGLLSGLAHPQIHPHAHTHVRPDTLALIPMFLMNLLSYLLLTPLFFSLIVALHARAKKRMPARSAVA